MVFSQQAARASACQRALSEHLLPGYGPVKSVNLPVGLYAAGRGPDAGLWGSQGVSPRLADWALFKLIFQRLSLRPLLLILMYQLWDFFFQFLSEKDMKT